MRKQILGKKRFRAAMLSAAMLVVSIASPFITSNFISSDVSAATIDANFAKALQYSLYFYDANMCGSEAGETSLHNWRGDCHTQDCSVQAPNGQTVDLCGGYHDAGDHVKFGLPQAYTASMLEWGYYEFPNAYASAKQKGHFETVTNYFAEYFKKSTIMDSSGNVQYFCYQVGDGHLDHSEWEAPEVQGSMSRPAFWASSSNPATDIVSNTAGALALHYANTGDAESLTYAKALYNFAKNNSKAVATQGAVDFYKSESYLDDMAWAAACLYAATKDSSYRTEASGYISQAGYSYTSSWPLCWDGMWPAVNAMMGDYNTVKSQISGATGSNNFYFATMWGSARYNTAVQLCALVVAKHTGDNNLANWAQNQMKYLMGDNNQNKCYIVGYNEYSVKYPHHRASSGLSDANDTGPHKHLLLGALVGGPEDAGGGHQDVTSNYVGNEVAIDYNAAFVGACAGLYEFFGAGQQPDSNYYIDGSSPEEPIVTTTTEPEVTTTPEPETTTTEPIVTTVPDEDDPLSDIDVDAADIKLLAQIILGVKKGSSSDYEEYDLNNDGKLTSSDLAIAKRAFAYNETKPVQTTVPPATTTPPPVTTTPPATTTTPPVTTQDSGSKTVTVNKTLTSGSDATNNVKVELEGLLPTGKTPDSFVFTLSASSAISIYQGAFGISVDNSCPAKTSDYWYMGSDFEVTGSGNTITVTFNVPSTIKDYINPGYGANIYLGCWYCNTSVQVESVTCNYS